MTAISISKISDKNFLRIVCVGSSAGGLEALISLFKALPQKNNMAFVLIQHLEPLHKSELPEILARETGLAVCEAKNNIKVEASHIYAIPPNSFMTISRRKLKITRRIKRVDGTYLPVDLFMMSLAKEEKEKAFGIILSGTGSDGTKGAKAIKDQGGIVFAQNEETARYFGMPGSVITGGFADFILKPEDIARKLIYIAAHGLKINLKHSINTKITENALNMILILLKEHAGVDFAHYKQNTIRRRIALRMSFHSIKNHIDYFNYLKKEPSEVNVLLRNLLISVTGFFRDSKVFGVIRKKLFPVIVKNTARDSIRIWVPACSSGEEVYSLAISLYEFLEERKIKPRFVIFGTDLCAEVIEKARTGAYSKEITSQVSSERLRRFFTKTENHYKIAKHIRDLCIFAKHDITSDPPLSNMDLESCRNLLIYMDGFLQNKVLSMLHYSLKPEGFLILGTSESVTAMPSLFSIYDKKNKIFTRNITAKKLLPATSRPGLSYKSPLPQNVNECETNAVVFKEADKSDIFIDSKKNGIDMVNMKNPRKDIKTLKMEFVRTVERLKAVSEEKDTFNEELRAANEEVQSSNEELQSMNEELETSKEELQSTNEELLTLNDELQNKNAELMHLNSDLSNVFASTNIPIIIVGSDLRIKRFTPTARKLMNLIATDINRPIGDIKPNIEISNMEELILDVIEDMTPKEKEVKDKDGRWHSMRIRPYRTIDNKIDGAVIALIDIDFCKKSREEVQGILNYNQAIIETMREPLVVLDKDLIVMSVNKAFCDTFRIQASDVKDRYFYEINSRQWNNPALKKLLGEVLPKKNYFNDFEISLDINGMEKKIILLNGQQIKLQGKDSPLILMVMEDITKHKKAEAILKRDNKTLDYLIEKRTGELMHLKMEIIKSKHLSAIGTLAATVAHELRNPLTHIALAIHRVKKMIKNPAVEKILTGVSERVTESDYIINNILMYSKTTITNYKPVKINHILKITIDEVKQKFTAAKIAVVDITKATKDIFIEADPIRIKEVFFNIICNAFEAVNADTGIIQIKSRIDDSHISVLIKDNGIGIDKKDLKNIESPFYTTKTKGTGLGLSLCKHVVAIHKGSIIFKSIKGKGTTVTVTLPIHKGKDEKKDSDNR